MDKEELVKTLKEIKIFKRFTDEELKRIVDIVDIKTYPPNAIIFSKQSKADTFFVIIKGEVRIYREKENRERQLIAILEDGEMIGEKVLFPGNYHINTVLSGHNRPAILIEITQKDFQEIDKIQLDTKTLGNKLLAAITESLIDRLYHAGNKIIALTEIGQIVGEETSLKKVAERSLKVIFDTIPSKKALFFIFNQYTNRMEIGAIFGYDEKTSKISLPKDDGIVTEALKYKRVITNQDIGRDEFKKFGYETKKFIIAPIILGGSILGAIFLGDKIKGAEFSNNNKVLLRIVSGMLAPAVERIRMKKVSAAEEEMKRKYIEF